MSNALNKHIHTVWET